MHVKDMVDWFFYLPGWHVGEREIDGDRERDETCVQ